MDEESARGATGSVYYFLDLYRYAFMTGNTTELAAMSDDQCKFCQSTINDADDAHKKGGWANKWDQEIVSATYYEKLEGYDYNRIKVVINYGATISCHEAGAQPQSSEPINGQILNFGVHHLPRRQLRRSPMPLKSAGPLPCWWSRVVRGWASCCGHDVLPLSLDDPGGVVTRSSRALVTADKGNGPQCVRSFVTWVRDLSSTGWPRTHTARGGTKMNIEDIEVFIGTGRR